MFAPSQWETVLLCNDVSGWLAASLTSALYLAERVIMELPSIRLTLQDCLRLCDIWTGGLSTGPVCVLVHFFIIKAILNEFVCKFDAVENSFFYRLYTYTIYWYILLQIIIICYISTTWMTFSWCKYFVPPFPKDVDLSNIKSGLWIRVTSLYVFCGDASKKSMDYIDHHQLRMTEKHGTNVYILGCTAQICHHCSDQEWNYKTPFSIDYRGYISCEEGPNGPLELWWFWGC